MKTQLLTYLTIILSTFAGIAQNSNKITAKVPYREIRLTNIQFSIGDTSIPYSLLVEPTGEIDFEEGYNFSFAKIGIVSFHFEGKRKNTETFKDTIVSTNDKPVNLSSYFPPLNQDSTKFINGYDFEFEWSPHYEYEIMYSYIFNGISANKLYQSDLDSVVRIIVPEVGIDKEIQNIFQLNLKQRPIEIQYIKAKHHYNGEFEILEKGTSIVSKQKQIEMLFNEFRKFNFTDKSHFIKVDGSIQYFIEFKTEKTYFAGMRHYLNRDGRIPENAFPLTVYHLYQRNKKRK
jgi:hypothetical protein